MTATLPNWPTINHQSLALASVVGGVSIPLWNLSSIGGTIWRTFLSNSLVEADMFGSSDMACQWVERYFVDEMENRMDNLKCHADFPQFCSYVTVQAEQAWETG